VAGHEGYLTVGMYDDGFPGELFITMSKEGSTIGGLMDSLGTAISVALQYGVPIESLVNKFAHQRFEPMGMSTNRDIPFAKSLVDYIFRWMGMEFIKGYREANAPPRPQSAAAASPAGNLNGNSITDGAAGIAAAAVTVKEDDSWSKLESRSSISNAGDAARQMNGPGQSNVTAGPMNRLAESTGNGRLSEMISDPARIAASPTSSPSIHSPGQYANGSDGSTMLTMALAIDTHSQTITETSAVAVVNPLDQSNASLMGDAPACDVCGSITVRNGSCYKCMNCGQSMGCS
jgi:ribonucleoside-diphosphate reductase alpha chain